MRIKILFALSIFVFATTKAQQEDYLIEPLPNYWKCDTVFEQIPPDEDLWWHNFEDQNLERLINIAVKRNYSVLSALENIRIAKATWQSSKGDLFPIIDFNTGMQRSKTSGNIASTEYKEDYSRYYNATISVNWQIDIFGSIYMRSKAQKALFHATEEEYRAVMITLCANVARNYFSLKQSLAQIEVLNENATSQKEIMNLVEVRYNSGLASKLDLAQARSVYYSTKASIPAMETNIVQYRNALALLLGVYPEEINNIVKVNNVLPYYIDPIAVGVPTSLLRRRPDIRAAEKRIESYTAQYGATKRDWLPEFYIDGYIGLSSTDIKDFTKSHSSIWEISPTIKWNIFNGNKDINTNIEIRAKLEQCILEYNNTVLTAIQEVENAMAAYKGCIKQIAALRETVNQNKEMLELSLNLYRQGLTQFQNVLDAQRTLLNYQNYLVQAQGNSLLSLIQLYEALGGGWKHIR